MTSLFENRKYAIDYDYLVQYFSEEEIKRMVDEAAANAESDKKKNRIIIMIIGFRGCGRLPSPADESRLR